MNLITIQTDSEAESLYRASRNSDPLPDIQSALLNSADIINYINEVGMIFPFETDKETVKAASIALKVGGEIIHFDNNGKPIKTILDERNQVYILQKNTIAYVSLQSKLRLPHYIAARFNLQITYVHRGLLLGTGPLVDPGFNGKILIPLHNLTNNDYEVKYGDTIIWMEFTKLSMSDDFKLNIGDEIKEKFFPFKKESIDLPAMKYLAKASPHQPIVSSVAKVIKDAEDLNTKAETAINRMNYLGVISIATLCIGLGTFLYNSFIMHNQNVNDFQKISTKIDSLNAEIDFYQLKQKNLLDSITTKKSKVLGNSKFTNSKKKRRRR